MKIDIDTLLMCLAFYVVLANTEECDKNHPKNLINNNLEGSLAHRRVKRFKYFDSPPPGAKVYRRPSYGFPPRSIISYTPPPNYKMEGDDPPYPQPPRSYGRKPESLGDEDVNNIIKYLSKQDLDKIITLASLREMDNYNKKVAKSDRDADFQRQVVQTQTDEKFSLNGPYVKANNEQEKPYPIEYDNSISNSIQDIQKYINTAHVINIRDSQKYQYLVNNLRNQVPNTQIYNQDSVQNYEKVYGEDLAKDEEEKLPRPVNLREDLDEAFDAAQTRQVESVTRPDPNYKVENFGDLPVMDYHSKRFSVSSYNVPHYTITSNSKYSHGGSAQAKGPPVEPAPPTSEAKEQSDAHLKAIKIWSHRSKGQAYTLHDDGTLSLEKPFSSKRGPYGH